MTANHQVLRGAVVTLALTVVLIACATRDGRDTHSDQLGAEIDRLGSAAAPGSTIDLRLLRPDITWDRLLVVGPYPDGDEFRKAAGFDWYPSVPGGATTETNTVALATAEEIVVWTTLPGSVYFLAEEDTWLSVERDHAQFSVELDPEDGVSRQLAPPGVP